MTEETLLQLGQWGFLSAFVFMTIAAIWTVNAKLITYAIILGVLSGLSIKHRWFSYRR